MKKILTILSLVLTITANAGSLQNSDFATSAAILGAGGSISQLLNTSKIYDSTNGQLFSTTITNLANSYNAFTGDSGAGGVKGLVPAPAAGDAAKCLLGDGTWGSCAGSSVTAISIASANGFTGSSSGGSTPALTIATSITGVLKGNGTAISAASAGTDYEVPLTFSTGLTRAVNTITVNTTQNIAKLSNLTTNGFVKTSGGDGTLSVDTTSYQAAFITVQEIPTGLVNNANTSFSLAHTPVSDMRVILFQDGLALIQGTDYTISGATITMTTAPNFGQTVYAKYDY